jgi:hypothetical protein
VKVPNNGKKPDDDFSEKEAQARFEAMLKGARPAQAPQGQAEGEEGS